MKILILLLFITSSLKAQTIFPEPFFFGLASAPGHAEDQLNDIWKAWGEAGKIRAWETASHPQRRLNFWSNPEVELDLAQKTGIEVYRLGIDWGRIMPRPHEFDSKVIQRYHEILDEVKKRDMKIMLTLMHHSVPLWVQESDGWKNEETKKHFLEFSKKMIEEYQSKVEYWITFNEANVFATLAYTAGFWPPGEKGSFTSMLALGPFRGESVMAMDHMSESHNEIYKWAHQKFPAIKIGIAHNMAYYTGKSFLDRMSAWYVDHLMNWRFPDKIQGNMDFFGFNYYGAEWIRGQSVDIDPKEEYSEAGRAIYPQGLYFLLKEISKKYSELPIIITENGIADATDVLRPAYLIEHLKAISRAKNEGANVTGYIFWTLSDNMEWADGYCPKFGLVEVDRPNNLKRIPRPSYSVFSQIVTKKEITEDLRASAWKLIQDHQGKERYFCRAQDGITPLDVPVFRKFSSKDWRFR